MLRRGLRKHYFGSFLTQPEKEWLLWEIGAFLEKGGSIVPKGGRSHFV
jgi:hypothetical protein